MKNMLTLIFALQVIATGQAQANPTTHICTNWPGLNNRTLSAYIEYVDANLPNTDPSQKRDIASLVPEEFVFNDNIQDVPGEELAIKRLYVYGSMTIGEDLEDCIRVYPHLSARIMEEIENIKNIIGSERFTPSPGISYALPGVALAWFSFFELNGITVSVGASMISTGYPEIAAMESIVRRETGVPQYCRESSECYSYMGGVINEYTDAHH